MNTNNHFIYNITNIIQDFAIKHNKLLFPTRYKNKIEQYLDNEIPNKIARIDSIMKHFENFQDEYNKNPLNSSSIKEDNEITDEFENELDIEDFYLYVELLKITDKFLLIPIGKIPSDNSELYEKILYQYFEKYKINYDKLDDYNLYLHKQYKKLDNFKIKLKS